MTRHKRLAVLSTTAIVAGLVIPMFGSGGTLRPIAWHALGLYHRHWRGRFFWRIVSDTAEPKVSLAVPAALGPVAVVA